MSLLHRIRLLFTDSNRNRSKEDDHPALLDHLPVDLQFLILTLLPPEDLCRLGASSRYWRALVRDPLLWRYFLMRDAPQWTSVDYSSCPRVEFLSKRVEETPETEMLDYMAEYLRCSPECRSRWRCAAPSALAFLQQYLGPEAEPRFAMLGAGLEQLDVLLLSVMMNSPHVLSVAGTAQRQINGVGSGISFNFSGSQKFNVITLYSTNRAERERARQEGSSVSSKIFILEEDEGKRRRRLNVAPQIQEAVRTVNAFIYTVNAERESTGVREEEFAQICAVLDPEFGSPSRPLLVFSCISRDNENRRACSCVDVAHQLQLPLLPNPWMVQDVVAESLAGLLDGVGWLLAQSRF